MLPRKSSVDTELDRAKALVAKHALNAQVIQARHLAQIEFWVEHIIVVTTGGQLGSARLHSILHRHLQMVTARHVPVKNLASIVSMAAGIKLHCPTFGAAMLLHTEPQIPRKN